MVTFPFGPFPLKRSFCFVCTNKITVQGLLRGVWFHLGVGLSQGTPFQLVSGMLPPLPLTLSLKMNNLFIFTVSSQAPEHCVRNQGQIKKSGQQADLALLSEINRFKQPNAYKTARGERKGRREKNAHKEEVVRGF